MIEDFKKIVEEGIASKDVNVFGKEALLLSKKYGVCEKTVYNRFKSMFGTDPRSYISDRIMPTYEQAASLILCTDSTEEFQQKLGLSGRAFRGFYDKYFGVSTHQKAKVKLLFEKQPVKYEPNIFDNYSLLASQILGDGYYNVKRHSLRVSHGIKQAEYLKWKVSLINKAYPNTSPEVVIREHAQGHQYADWYSRKLGNVDIPYDTPEKLVGKLTPLGWLLWYFDDGSYTQDVTMCITNDAVRYAAIKELETYGIICRETLYEKNNSLICCGQQHSVRFYKNFLEPFIHIIPECMKYKVEDIVGRVGI